MTRTFIAKHPDGASLTEAFNNRLIYYTRSRGLFRYCYPKEKPPASAVQIYLSPVETHCSNIDYFPQTEEDKSSPSFNEDIMARLHLARSVIAAFVLSFVAIFCAFWTGLSGCWKRSAGAITATAILMLTACLLAAGAMGLWHTVEFFEKEKVVGEDFFQSWTTVLRDNTRISYDWSYIVAWAGVASSLLASILLSGAAVCLRGEREKEEQLNLQYLMPGKYPMIGAGGSGVSESTTTATAISYPLSHIANLLSPVSVYPQKQPPYPYGGFPQPQLYPQPYYHGSQYGPYNY
ncbi:conserved hypothetical protein [Culex quinquefasciatus]|uniref:Uncharacterized protein n=1 Tax=Culex quinquefasciatus TaxID=7176 RepID=B0WF99_CULQU|nr:conserved hypothetical protein [Culex quinquefasciatus]|eukprot:XP_001847383.1 conserved hypothetical protein [Culex quinquefasciatus]